MKGLRVVEASVKHPEGASVRLQDRVYARAFALTVRGEPAEDAIDELLELAEVNPHLLGHVRGRLAVLAEESDGEAHVDRAVALVTYAWLRAISAA